ncbi:G-protein coupled estrogen receptor 1 [Latimeria chalumnae]|uniref:G-protein coupled estrogen receptor 1 n=1 Tax=Latimeria chalumnae TaxID=7897 RepID=UPI00313B1CCE
MPMELSTASVVPATCNYTDLELNVSYLCNESVCCGSFGDVPESNTFYIVSLFLSCLYTVFLFPIGFIGNLLILVVNLSHRDKMTIPDFYFVNLAIADLILVADSLIEVFNLNEKYYDITILCTFMSLFLQINMYSSIFFLTWMSFDRYIALTKVMKSSPLRTMQYARISCGLIWMASIFATLLPFTIVQAQYMGDVPFCFADVREIQWLEVTLGFVIPFLIIGFCYSLIIRVLMTTQKHNRLRPRRQKALRMILVVVLVFFFCWLPENVFISIQLLQDKGKSIDKAFRHNYSLMEHIVNLAAFSNSCLNPLIYSFLGETFRDKMRSYIKEKVSMPALYTLCENALKFDIPVRIELSED